MVQRDNIVAVGPTMSYSVILSLEQTQCHHLTFEQEALAAGSLLDRKKKISA